MRVLGVNIGFMVLVAAGISAQAAEIKVLSGNGARAAVSELAARFERAIKAAGIKVQ